VTNGIWNGGRLHLEFIIFLSILVTRSTSHRSRQHYCKILLICVNRRLSYCYCAKIQDGGRHLGFYFFSIFWHHVCRTSNVIHVPNFVQLCAIINELWAIDKIWNGGLRHLEFIIFCSFWSNIPFLVAAVYIGEKFHTSTSISNRVIAVCAKIQDGGRRHFELYFCSIFWHSCKTPTSDLQRNTRAKFHANMCNMSDRWNSKWRPPLSWIYYFCPFWSNGLFPVAAVYISAKFHSSTSIGGWVIAVCAKIQDDGRRHLEL